MGSVAMEEFELMKDDKYRAYVSAVDKALKAFGSYDDWPDLISALGKLNKVITDYQRFPVIPRRIKISKRLAQCMHKALPGGVHIKALEVYDTIFKCMGTHRLSHELFIYSAGLFPLLGYSAIYVNPHLLRVYETHFVPLGPRLLPGLSGFLSGVLPGLEDGADHFDRTNALLEKVCDGVGPTAFYGCLWQCVAGNAAVRLPAVTFVLSHFNQKLSMEDQLHIMGTSVEVMIKGLCAGVRDSNNALVQRASLDLLLVGFPMHNTQLSPDDMVRLVTAALSSICRRDVSLNRRLYSWLLGSELNIASLPSNHPYLHKISVSSDLPKTSVYFDMYSKEHLIEAVKATLNEMKADIRPYRLLTSLLDKPDVGPVILDGILFEVFRVLYITCQTEQQPCSPKIKQDIIKNANLFFSSLESWYIWQYLGSLFDQSCRLNSEEQVKERESVKTESSVKPVGSGIPNIWEVCELCEFLLGVIPVEVNLESPCEHLMNLLLRLVALLTKHLDSFTHDQLYRTLSVCRTLLKKTQPRRTVKPNTEPAVEGEVGRSLEVVRPLAIRTNIGREKTPSEPKEIAPEPEVELPNNKPETRLHDTEFGLMLKSFLKSFQTFFVAFVCGGRILNNSCVPKAFDKLKKLTVNKNQSYADELRKLLNTVIAERDSNTLELMRQASVAEAYDLNLVVLGNEVWGECFAIASDILLDASMFPLCFTTTPSDSIVLPPWIKTLLVCCCFLEKSPKLQLTAIRTFLELVNPSASKAEGSTELVTALLETSQIIYIQKSTNIVKVVTEVLWGHLGQLNPQLQVTCISLLHQLLNTFTLDDSIENILGESLLRGDETTRVNSLLRFIKLWTIGRELQDGRQKRCFQTCLLKILDNLLLSDNSPLRLQTEAWLGQALMRGDLARLLDPLLLILLDPATARLGILHVSIEPSITEVSQEETPLDDTSKIYAISSVDGNVIYHVSDSNVNGKNGITKRLKWRWKKESPSEQRVFAVTSLKGSPDSQLRYITEKNVARGIELPRHNNGEVSLFVNPLNAREDDEALTDSAHPYSEVIQNARRFNPATGAVDYVVDAAPQITIQVATEDTLPKEKFTLKNRFLQQLEFEESESAHEFFGTREKSEHEGFRISRDIVDQLVDSVVRKCEVRVETPGVGVHPLHPHLLLYCGVYDSTRTLYAFNTLRNILFTNPRLFLCCSATSGTVSASFPSDLLFYLARHRKSILGRSFEGPVNSLNDYVSPFRSSMYLEVLVSVCLYFARSYYPNLGHRLTAEVLAGNRLVQLTSIETLTDILTELTPLVRESGKGFASYIATILSQCKVQKIVLHCIMAGLSIIQQQQQLYTFRVGGRTFTEEIIEFNDASDGISLTEHSRALQVQLLKLVFALLKLEHYVDSYKSEVTDSSGQSAIGKEGVASSQDSSYTSGYLVPQQPLFFRAVNSALSLKGSMRGLHSHWTGLVTSSLPYLGVALPQIVMITINQLCINIEELATFYVNPISEEELPLDYTVNQLEALTVLCHYCVLDSTQQVSPLSLTTATSGGFSGISGPNPGQILNNLVHVFTPLPLMQECKDRNQQAEILMNVRLKVVSHMPRIISSLSALWTAVSENPASDEIAVWGCPRVVRSQILEFLSPLSLHHGPCFLSAIAVAWHERRNKTSEQVLPVPTPNQKVLVNLIGSIKVMPIDTLVQTVHLVLKQPPAVEGALQDMCLEVSVLELFYVYMQTSSGTQLRECWSSLLALLRDGLLLAPPALFLVLAILNEFVQRSPSFQEKKDQRDLQDITAKLVEACGTVAGACLEQTTWLKRNISVKDLDSIDEDSSTGQAVSPLLHSVQAQLVLAQVLSSLLDISYGSQEKEKVATLLIAVMCNVTPYLKNHQVRYAASFQACSQLLASISGYPYTRKAWKKDAFELLLDPALFQMEAECLSFWTTIVDNLMTHDQTTFHDLMSRISMAQSGSYNLFSSREQEYEQRAQLLKRLAFVIISSEKDHYHKFMSTIQDRLTESLRLPQVVPSIQAQVFFCFRILLLRMSPNHVTSLWPIIISEMVQVFMHIEQELTNETEEFSSHIKVMSALDASWVVNSSNGLNAHGHPHWLMLTLAAAKLLDLAVLLPANHLPQFQMYRWAFVADNSGNAKQEAMQDFIPHVKRICKLMDEKWGTLQTFVRAKESHLLLTDNNIESLQQLHYFFHSLQSRAKSSNVDVPALENHILKDFLDKIPTSPVH